MPACFQLFPSGAPEPATLNSVDEAICKHLGVDVHPTYWVKDWYNVIGFAIAAHGHALGSPELRAYVTNFYDNDEIHARYIGELLRVLDFLELNYRSSAWIEIGKR